MRKMKKFFVATLVCMLACVCFLFTGCSAGKGTYEFESVKTKSSLGYSVTLHAGDEFQGVTLTEDISKMTLRKDGKAILRIEIGKDVEVMMGEWIKEGKEIYVDFDGEVMVIEKDGRRITGEFYGAEWTLKK